MKTVSVIILAHNKSRYSEIALNGLLQTSWPAVQVILVDNGSTDNTEQVFAAFAVAARQRDWQVEIIALPENAGAIEGRNRAIEAVTGDFVVFLDNDVVVGVRSWLERLTAILEAERDIGVLGPKILFAGPPNLIQCAGCAVSPEGRVDFRGRGASREQFSTQEDVQCLISACWIMPAAVMQEVGALDMQFHPVQFEDIDYCYRIREAGYRAVYTPSVFMYHFENVTSDGTPALNYRYLTVKNGMKFKKKWHHVFSEENGPSGASMVWEELPHVSFSEIGDLQIDD